MSLTVPRPRSIIDTYARFNPEQLVQRQPDQVMFGPAPA